MPLEAGDIGYVAASVVGSASPTSSQSPRPTQSCLITSVVNSSEPLLTVPMRFERFFSGLLALRPVTSGSSSTAQHIAQGLTVRISFAPGGAVEVLEAADMTSSPVGDDYYVIEMVTIHSGSEHAPGIYDAVGEMQFILNPINNTNRTSAPSGRLGGPRTVVISVPLVVGTAIGATNRFTSPARSFMTQLLVEVRALATEIGGGLSGGSTGIAAPSSTAEGETTITTDEDDVDAPVYATGDPILNVGVAGTGGFNTARIYWANTVPLLPVPVRTFSTRVDVDDEVATTVEMVPTVMYAYEGTLTFPPCLPVDNGTVVPDYTPDSNFSRFFATYLGGTGGPNIPVSTPTVQHIVTPAYVTTQATIDAIAFLSATPSLTVIVSDASTVYTTYVPVTTSRPPQNRSGRAFTPLSTALPLFEDTTPKPLDWDYQDDSNVSVKIGTGSPLTVSGICTVSQRIHQHGITILRSNHANTRLRTVIIVLSLLCFSVLVYIILLLLVRCDFAELPTAVGGKRAYVDFWTNPRSVLPARFDDLDADASSHSSEDIQEEVTVDVLGRRRRKRHRVISAPYDNRSHHTHGAVKIPSTIRSFKKPQGSKRKNISRSWLQDDADDSKVDLRMLMPMGDSTRNNTSQLPPQVHQSKEGAGGAKADDNPLMPKVPKNKLAFNMQATTMTKVPANVTSPHQKPVSNPLQSPSKR